MFVDGLDGAILVDGMDEAILGVAYRAGSDPIVAYDIGKIIKILMERDGMSREDSVEFYEFNIEQAYMGSRTPYFIDTDALETWRVAAWEETPQREGGGVVIC